MKNKITILKKIFTLLFMLCVSVSVIPCGIVNTHGLFGEVTASVVVSEQDAEIAELSEQIVSKTKRIKGINIYNIWLLIVAIIIYRCFMTYVYRLPREDNIVTCKVRMNN